MTKTPTKKPASEVTKLAKAISRDGSIRSIDLKFVPNGSNISTAKWFARAMPESFIVHRNTTEELKSLQRNTTMTELADIYAKHEKVPLAEGAGKTAEEALAALLAALELKGTS